MGLADVLRTLLGTTYVGPPVMFTSDKPSLPPKCSKALGAQHGKTLSVET